MSKHPEIAHQKSASMDHLIAEAIETNPVFGKGMNEVIDYLQQKDPEKYGNIIFLHADLKEPAKAIGNVRDKFNGDASRSCDLVRGTIVASAEVIDDIVEEIEKRFGIVAMEDRISRPNKYGYRDKKLNIAMPNGHICELQILVQEIQDVRYLTHAARAKEKEITALADRENRDLTPEEWRERRRLTKFCLGHHNKAAKKGGLNDSLDQNLTDAERLMLEIKGYPVVDFKQVAHPPDNAPKSEVSIQLAEGLSFTFLEEETCEA